MVPTGSDRSWTLYQKTLQISFLSIRVLQIIAHRSKQISPLGLCIRQPLPPHTEKVTFLPRSLSLQHARSIHFTLLSSSRVRRRPGASTKQNNPVSSPSIETHPRSVAAVSDLPPTIDQSPGQRESHFPTMNG